MTGHDHPDHRHPSQGATPSLLRWSVAERLALVAVMLTGLWGALIWSLR